MKVFVFAQHAPQVPRLQALLGPAHEVVPLEAFPPTGELVADALVTTRLTEEQAPRLRCRLLQIPGAGLDGIALHALPPGCLVSNVYGHEVPMAEYAMLAVLQHCIRPQEMPGNLDAATWPAAYNGRALHEEAAGKAIGIVGLGHIGREIARRGRAFGMRTLGLSRSGAPRPELDWVGDRSRLDALLPQADFLALCCPLDDATRGLIGAEELRRMKPSAVLINLARAEVADEQALFEALRDRRIAGAFLDVWYRYPKPGETEVAPSRFPFHTLPNVRCTPHASAWTEQLLARRYTLIARNIARLDTGEPLENVVGLPATAGAA